MWPMKIEVEDQSEVLNRPIFKLSSFSLCDTMLACLIHTNFV